MVSRLVNRSVLEYRLVMNTVHCAVFIIPGPTCYDWDN